MRERRGDSLLFHSVAFLIMLLFGLSAVFPIILSLMVSITDERAILLNGYSLAPAKLSLLAYRMLLGESWVFRAYGITIVVTACGTFLCILLSSMIGFTLSRSTVKYRNAIAIFLYIPTIFSAGLIPWYLWVTRFLHLKNSILALILPSLINPFWIFLLRNYFQTVPSSFCESAEIDGASPMRVLLQVILPISRPIVATVVLFAALGYWNNYTNALWLIDKMSLYPLQYMLYKVQALVAYATNPFARSGVIKPSESVQMAAFVVTLGPVVVLYPFLQKYFTKGIIMGGIKG